MIEMDWNKLRGRAIDKETYKKIDFEKLEKDIEKRVNDEMEPYKVKMIISEKNKIAKWVKL
jgi:hypothetical protein